MDQEKRTILLKPTLKQKRAMMINDAIPGFLLLVNGIMGLGEETREGQYALLNIIAGIAMFLALVYEMRRKYSTGHKMVFWFGVITGLVLMIDAMNKWNERKIFQPALFYYLIGLFTVIRGLYHTRFPSARRLVITDEGFLLRTSPFRKIQIKWDDLETITMEDKVLIVTCKSGEIRKISLRRVESREEVFSLICSVYQPS